MSDIWEVPEFFNVAGRTKARRERRVQAELQRIAHEVLGQWMRGELKANPIPKPLSQALTPATESNIRSRCREAGSTE